MKFLGASFPLPKPGAEGKTDIMEGNMKTLKRAAALLLILVLTLSMAACGAKTNDPAPAGNEPNSAPAENDPNPAPADTETPASKYGGTLIVSQVGQQYEDNYYPPTAANADILQNARPCLEPLFEMASSGELIPFLVEDYEIQDNGKIYIFKIRQGVKFHDGTDLNAEAVKWNFEQTMAEGVHSVCNDISEMEVVDAYTLKLTMATANLFFINSLASSQVGFMVSPTAVEENGKDWAVTHPVGTGPFLLESWDYGVEIIYTRNENYWGKDADGNQLPYLDGITFKFVPEEVTVVTSFENGEIDMLRHMSTTSVAELEKDYNVTVYDYPAAAFYLWFPTNVDGSVFQDVRVRQAVSYAVDIPTIVGSLYGSEVTDVNQLSYKGSSLWDDTIAGYEYNPEKAKELLADAGYPDGFSTKIIIENNNDNSVLCETLKSYLADVGIDLEIDLADSARYAQTVIFSSWGDQLAVIPFNYSPDEICSMLRMLHPDTSLFAHTVRYPAEYRDMIVKMQTSSSLDEAKDTYKQINKYLIDEVCLTIPIFCNSYAIATQDYVHGTGAGLDGETQIRYWSPETVWMDK